MPHVIGYVLWNFNSNTFWIFINTSVSTILCSASWSLTSRLNLSSNAVNLSFNAVSSLSLSDTTRWKWYQEFTIVFIYILILRLQSMITHIGSDDLTWLILSLSCKQASFSRPTWFNSVSFLISFVWQTVFCFFSLETFT